MDAWVANASLHEIGCCRDGGSRVCSPHFRNCRPCARCEWLGPGFAGKDTVRTAICVGRLAFIRARTAVMDRSSCDRSEPLVRGTAGVVVLRPSGVHAWRHVHTRQHEAPVGGRAWNVFWIGESALDLLAEGFCGRDWSGPDGWCSVGFRCWISALAFFSWRSGLACLVGFRPSLSISANVKARSSSLCTSPL